MTLTSKLDYYGYLNSGRTDGGDQLRQPRKRRRKSSLNYPDTYTTIGELVGSYAKPDNRDLLIKTYGDQGITGFLKLTGAVNAAATQDEVQYWEKVVVTNCERTSHQRNYLCSLTDFW